MRALLVTRCGCAREIDILAPTLEAVAWWGKGPRCLVVIRGEFELFGWEEVFRWGPLRIFRKES